MPNATRNSRKPPHLVNTTLVNVIHLDSNSGIHDQSFRQPTGKLSGEKILILCEDCVTLDA
jgi:hypothetical protein